MAARVVFAVIAIAGVAIVLWPYWMALLKNPINQMPIPHGSRDNYILQPFSGINFWIIPMGALILAIPVHRHARLRGDGGCVRCCFGWYVTALLGLGGTTPAGKLLLGRAYQGSDLRTLHLLGHDDGHAIRRHAGGRADPSASA